MARTAAKKTKSAKSATAKGAGRKTALKKLTAKARTATKSRVAAKGRTKGAEAEIEYDRSVQPPEERASSTRNTRSARGKAINERTGKRPGSFKDRQNAQPSSISPSSRK